MGIHIIENNIIINTILATFEEASKAFPNAELLNADIGGAIGDQVIDGEIVVDPISFEKQIELAVQAKEQEIESEFKLACAQLKSGYTQEEIESWPEQTAEVAEYLKDNSVETVMLSGIAAGKGKTVAEFVEGFLVKKQNYSKRFGEALGKKNARESALNKLDKTKPDFLTLLAEV